MFDDITVDQMAANLARRNALKRERTGQPSRLSSESLSGRPSSRIVTAPFSFGGESSAASGLARLPQIEQATPARIPPAPPVRIPERIEPAITQPSIKGSFVHGLAVEWGQQFLRADGRYYYFARGSFAQEARAQGIGVRLGHGRRHQDACGWVHSTVLATTTTPDKVQLWEDADGLRFTCDLPSDHAGQEVVNRWREVSGVSIGLENFWDCEIEYQDDGVGRVVGVTGLEHIALVLFPQVPAIGTTYHHLELCYRGIRGAW
jgi:hypothetical protein